VKKSGREIMEILEAFDRTGCAHSAAGFAGVDPKTVRRYVARREAGDPVDGQVRRAKLIDPFVAKIEELVEASEGAVRADVVHERLVAMGFTGDERTTRRAVSAAKQAWRDGHRRGYRPWITEPGLWVQFDWGAGPIVFGPDGRPRHTMLFCAWLAWSRFRVVIPTWDRRMGTLLTCLDTTLRRFGGVPSFALTDNEKTVTVEHVAGVPVRHPAIVAAGRHYGLTVHTCVPCDPESKGGSEATVRVAKADLVPTSANLRTGYNSFAELVEACEGFCAKVNHRLHRETARIPAEALVVEQSRMHPLPAAAFTAAAGETRTVNTDQTIRFGSVRYSTPSGLVGREVWVRVEGEELVITAHMSGQAGSAMAGAAVGAAVAGLTEVARHRLSTPGHPRIDLSHYPDHPQRPDGAPKPPRPRPRSDAEEAFLALGPGAHTWLVEAAAAGAPKVRSKMHAAVELAALIGVQPVDAALGVAATAGRFAESDLVAIVAHQAAGASAATLVIPDDDHSAQPGTNAWAAFGARRTVHDGGAS
jgi:transposase